MARCSPSSAPTGPASPRSCARSPGCTGPRPARSCATAPASPASSPEPRVMAGISLVPGGPAAVPVADRGGEPAGRRGTAAGPGPGPWSASTRCSPGCPSGAASSPRSCPAASSRPSRSGGRCSRTREILLLDELSLGPVAARRAPDLRADAGAARGRDDDPARRAGRQPGAPGRLADPVPARGPHLARGTPGRVHARARSRRAYFGLGDRATAA